MNNKQLAEMIKSLRKQKLDEYQVRSGPTHTLVGTKTPAGRASHADRASMPKSGKDVKNRYKLSTVVEKKENSNTKSTIINTTPEQDSAMIGTQ